MNVQEITSADANTTMGFVNQLVQTPMVVIIVNVPKDITKTLLNSVKISTNVIWIKHFAIISVSTHQVATIADVLQDSDTIMSQRNASILTSVPVMAVVQIVASTQLEVLSVRVLLVNTWTVMPKLVK